MIETFGERLRRLRKARSMTTTLLGERCGASNVSIHWWETDRCKPQTDKLKAISRALGVSLDYLVTGSEEPRAAALHAAIRAGVSRDQLLAMLPR